jgi:hypothetical protein
MAFLLFVGFMSFSLGVVGIIAMCYLYVCYLGQLYLYFKFPRFVGINLVSCVREVMHLHLDSKSICERCTISARSTIKGFSSVRADSKATRSLVMVLSGSNIVSLFNM